MECLHGSNPEFEGRWDVDVTTKLTSAEERMNTDSRNPDIGSSGGQSQLASPTRSAKLKTGCQKIDHVGKAPKWYRSHRYPSNLAKSESTRENIETPVDHGINVKTLNALRIHMTVIYMGMIVKEVMWEEL